jgi:hypothetical protein
LYRFPADIAFLTGIALYHHMFVAFTLCITNLEANRTNVEVLLVFHILTSAFPPLPTPVSQDRYGLPTLVSIILS